MTPYPPGRYRFDAASRYWHSGTVLGPYVPLVQLQSAARMAGGYLTSPGGVILPPDSFVPNVTEANGSNTGAISPLGVPAVDGVTFPVTEGDLIITTPGTIITNREIRGYIDVRCADVSLDNLLGVGRPVTSSGAIKSGLVISSNGAAKNLKMNRVTLRPYGYRNGQWFDNTKAYDSAGNLLFDNYSINGIYGTGFDAYRCDISGANDGLFTTNANYFSLRSCYFHDFRFTTSDPSHGSDSRAPGWSHNDGVQISASTGFLVEGCTFDMNFHPTLGAGAPAATFYGETPNWLNAHGMLINPRNGTITGGVVRYNRFKRGEIGILGTNGSKGYDTGNSVQFLDNLITPNQTTSTGSHHTQAALGATLGTWSGVDTTRYSDDAETPSGLRGQLVPFSTISGSLTARIN